MKKFLEVFKEENISSGYLYFYVHFMTEIVCFFFLSRIVRVSIILWVSVVLYDILAFASQGIIGYAKDKIPKLNCGIIGIVIMIVAILNTILKVIPGSYTSISILGIGNAFMHVAGAEATIRGSKGKLSHSAFFVAGGSFGIIIGKILGNSPLSSWITIPLTLTMIPFCLLGDADVDFKDEKAMDNFNYTNSEYAMWLIVLLATFVVIIRGYAGYGIPTSWNKTTFQTILLYVFMGSGKALGGVLIDAYGMRKTALYSVTLSIPFLLCGNNLMIISLIGVMLFSMTMAVTLGLLVSVMKRTPGLAFGYTTIGLLLGSLPTFFIKITSYTLNSIIIVIMSLICLVILNMVIRKGEN